jgi:hypothetical protein
MPAIGLSGFAQSGKTTVANFIEKNYAFRRKHIAVPLRDMLAVLLRHNGLSDEMIYRYLEGDLKESVIPELGVTSRHAQITLGTEWGRELINPDLWANTWAFGVTERDRVMNDSVRFVNEEEVIKNKLKGFTILIVRPGTKPAKFKWGIFGEKLYDWFGLLWGAHASERTDLLNPTYVVVNDGTEEDLFAQIDGIMSDEGWTFRLVA